MPTWAVRMGGAKQALDPLQHTRSLSRSTLVIGIDLRKALVHLARAWLRPDQHQLQARHPKGNRPCTSAADLQQGLSCTCCTEQLGSREQLCTFMQLEAAS